MSWSNSVGVWLINTFQLENLGHSCNTISFREYLGAKDKISTRVGVSKSAMFGGSVVPSCG